MTAAVKTRDLEADLMICEAATPGPWEAVDCEVPSRAVWRVDRDKGGGIAAFISKDDARFISEARQGWPYAIRRALEAESEIDRLRNELNILQEQLEQRGCRT